MTTSPVTPTVARIPFRRVLLAGAIAIVASMVANLIIRWVGLLFVPLTPGFQPLTTVGPTVIFTTLFLVAATAVFALINRFTANPVRVFAIVSAIAFVVTLAPDIMLLVNPAAMAMGTPSAGEVLILIAMHVVSYAITLWVFLRWAPRM